MGRALEAEFIQEPAVVPQRAWRAQPIIAAVHDVDHPVASSLLPVVLLIGIGFAAGRLKLIRGEAVRDLSNLVFLVLVQALLFRTMATADLRRGWTCDRWRCTTSWRGPCSLRCCSSAG